MIPKPEPAHRSPAFLRWAHEQAAECCLCRAEGAQTEGPIELHHWGEKGMGQRGSDLLVARVCQRHHGAVQGKRSAMSFGRIGRIDQFAAILEDTVRLLSGYVAHLETRR